MTAHDDLDHQLNSFLREGPTELPYQSFDAVRDRTEQTRQRAFVGPWRTPIMNRFVTIGLGSAAMAAALVIGVQLLGPSTNVGGPSSEPTPTHTQQPTGAESPSNDGSLPLGSHELFHAPAGRGLITVTIPAPGWYGQADSGHLIKRLNPNAPDGAVLYVYDRQDLLVGSGAGDLYVYGDPCHWASTKPDAPVTTVDEAVAALANQTSRDASAPESVYVDRHLATTITLHVPDDVVFSDCDNGDFRTLVEGQDNARTHQDPGQIDKLWILDVDGELVVIDIGYYAGTPQAVIDEMESMVSSMTFR